MSSPFYVAPRSSGYASGSRLDEKFLNKGREYPGRGEQWLPMWAKPSTYFEVQQVFLQGTCGNQSRSCNRWMDHGKGRRRLRDQPGDTAVPAVRLSTTKQSGNPLCYTVGALFPARRGAGYLNQIIVP